MSTSYKISLLKLETQSKLLDQELTKHNKYFVYPASPSLIKRVCPKQVYDNYMQLRKNYIEFSSTNEVYDPRLRPYQNQDVAFMTKTKNKANFNQQRLGKTPETLVSLKYRPFKKLIIIVPKSTIISWEQECEKWLGQKPYRLRGSQAQRIKAYQKYNIFISSYGIPYRDLDIMPNFDTIIVDEAHRLRNFRGQQSKNSPKTIKAIMTLSYKANERIALTGTPAPNYSYNIFAILHFLFPSLFSSFWNFINYYYKTEKEIYNIDGDSKTNILEFKPHKKQELQEFLELISIQRKRKNFMQWLPPVDEKIITLPLTPQQNKLYQELLDTWEIPKANIICQTSLDLMIRQRQLAISPVLFNIPIISNKTEWILDYIEDYPDEQILIVSFFTSYLEYLQTLIPNTKILQGSTSDINRKKIETTFNNKEFPILLGNIDVTKEGMKLEQANTIIFVDPSLVYTDNEQIQDRIIPTNKEVALNKNKQQIIRLISLGTIDEYIYSQLQLKKSSSDIINDYINKLHSPVPLRNS